MRPTKERFEEIRKSVDSEQDDLSYGAQCIRACLAEIDALREERENGFHTIAFLHQKYLNSLDERDKLKAELDALKAECRGYTNRLGWGHPLLVKQLFEERDALRAHKKLLFEENGRLLAEKESGLWDLKHPVRLECDNLKELLRICLPRLNDDQSSEQLYSRIREALK
jgi:hypothetical protein